MFYYRFNDGGPLGRMFRETGCQTVELSEAKEGSVAEEKEEETEDSAIEENEDIYVHVCGEVNQPGVYCSRQAAGCMRRLRRLEA